MSWGEPRSERDPRVTGLQSTVAQLQRLLGEAETEVERLRQEVALADGRAQAWEGRANEWKDRADYLQTRLGARAMGQ